MTPAEFALQAVKGIKKSFDNAVKNKLEEYKDNKIFNFYPTTEVFEIFTSTEGMTGAKELSGSETPPTLALQDGYSVQIQEKRFGGAIEVLEADYRRWQTDSTLKVDSFLQRKRNQLLVTNVNLFLTQAFDMLNTGFATTNWAAPDAAAIFGTHTWKTGGTFANNATKALSSGAIDDMEEYGGAFQDAAGNPMPMDFDIIIVKKGSANEREAIRLFAKDIKPTAVNDINIYEGMKTIVATPYITSANKTKWFARASKALDNSLAVGIGDYPTLREPIKQNNEAIRTNCTGFWKQGCVNMPFDWYGSLGTA